MHKFGLSLCSALLLSACISARPPLIPPDARYLTPAGKVRVVGYNDMNQMLDALGQMFSQRHPGIHFEWVLKGTRTAPAALLDGSSAFAPMGAELEPGALAQWHKVYRNPPLAVPIAHDSLTPGALSSPTGIFVHTDNPLRTLSVETVRRVVAPLAHEPRITHWRELGVTGALGERPIQAIGLAEDTAIGALILRRIQAEHYVDDFAAYRQSRDVAAALAQSPAALGIANLNHARPEIRALSMIDADGRETAGDETGIGSGVYPFDRHLLIYVRKDHQGRVEPLAHAFLCLALSAKGHAVILRSTRRSLPPPGAALVDVRTIEPDRADLRPRMRLGNANFTMTGSDSGTLLPPF